MVRMSVKRDGRSKRAIAIDKSLQATVTYPNTPEGILKWRKSKGRADLRGYDTSRQERLSERWGRHKSSRSMIESVDKDLVDFDALIDKSLGGGESTKDLRRKQRDFMRF